MSFFKKIFSKEKKETLDKGLEKSKSSFFDKLGKAVAGKSKVDDAVLDNLEEVLVSSDVGVNISAMSSVGLAISHLIQAVMLLSIESLRAALKLQASPPGAFHLQLSLGRP